MVIEQSEKQQLAGSRDGSQSRNATKWTGKQPKGRKSRNPSQNHNSGDTANLHAFAPTGEDQQHLMIAEAAYYRAEKRGFTEGYSLDDWLLAEAEIKGMHSS